MKKYKKFIATGCSFSSGVFDNPTNSLEVWKNVGFSWPHYVFSEIWDRDSEFLNFALPGGGNRASFTNLIYYFELTQNCENVLVGINLTGLERNDDICYLKHPLSNQDLSSRHINEKLNISWIHNSQAREAIEKGIDELVILNCLGIMQGIIYLESKRIDYFFMLMTDSIYNKSPIWFKQFLDLRLDKWVKFDNEIGMLEFVEKNNLIKSKEDHHPSREGHRVISTYVMDHIKKRYE